MDIFKTGEVFGELTILNYDGKDKYYNKIYKCLCSCGNETRVSASKLKSGHTKTCAKCYRPKIGGKCGKWTVLSEVPITTGHNRMLLCKCDCGNTSIINASVLSHGKSNSCGKCNTLTIGDKFFKLTIVSDGGKDNANRQRWNCICSCGKLHNVDAYNLRSGNVKSCGQCYKTEFIVAGDISYGVLADGTKFYFDTIMLKSVSQKTWHTDKDGYIKTTAESGKGTKVLHRLLLPHVSRNKVIDHIDGNPRNNALANLRICTRQQNIFNQKISKANTSGYTGVWIKNGKYSANTGYNKQKIRLGIFDDITIAAIVRNEAAKLLFGEFARLNGMPEASQSTKNYVYNKCSQYLLQKKKEAS